MKREDEPIEEGTNINKKLFDRVDNDFLYEQANRMRVDRYNVPEYELNNDRNLLKLNSEEFEKITEYENNSIVNIQIPNKGIKKEGNILPTTGWSEVKAYTQYTSGNFEITASSYNSSSYRAYYASNGDISSCWRASSSYNTHWLTIKLDVPRIITKIKTYVSAGSYLSNWKIQGSNDNTTWDDLFISTENDSTLTEHELSTSKEYLYYRIYIAMTASTNCSIYEIETSEYYATIEDFPNLQNYLSLNNLEPKEIIFDKAPKVGDIYQLIYKEDKFYGFNIIDSINRNISIKTGTIADGGVIPKTDGFTNYAYIVSPASGTATYSIRTSTSATYEVTVAISCSVNQSTRAVVSKVSGVSGTANYIEIAWN